jgi:hypothetical protein
MPEGRPGLVDIVRDFLATHVALRELIERYRRGELRFAEVQTLFADDEESALFRLKERCHALFRSGDDFHRIRHREVLFDLAVGSLFHEAMAFRENFYQREVYGPRVRALREEAGAEAAALFREFEKIMSTLEDRLEQGMTETEALLARTQEQLVVLLCEHARDGRIARCLLEHRDIVGQVFREGLDALMASIYGSAVEGHVVAGRSYLESGYFEEAQRALEEAIGRGGDRTVLERKVAYARGMRAYLGGDYATSVAELARWAAREDAEDHALVDLARTAVATVDQLARGSDRDSVLAAARALLPRLSARRPSPAPT